MDPIKALLNKPLVTLDEILALAERETRPRYLAKAVSEGQLQRRPDLMVPNGAPILLNRLNDAAQRDSHRWAGLEIEFSENDDTVEVDGDLLQVAVFAHIQQVDAFFRASDGEALGNAISWLSTVAPRTDITLKRYRQQPAEGGMSPYEKVKAAAQDLCKLDTLRPLWTGSFVGAFARLKLDGTVHTEPTWASTVNIGQINRRCGAWNRGSGRSGVRDIPRRFRNWRSGLSPSDESWMRSPQFVDLLDQGTIDRMEDLWFVDEGGDIPRPQEVYMAINATLVPAASSLLHAMFRDPKIAAGLAAQEIDVSQILPTKIPEANPIAAARRLRGSATILATPEMLGRRGITR